MKPLFYASVIFVFLAAFYAVGYCLRLGLDASWRDQIVKHHAAEYYLDANHNRHFRWLDEKPSVEIKP